MVTQSSVSNYIHTKISFDSGTKVAVVTQYRISYYFHATVSFNCGTKVAVVTRYQLPNYFHITTYPLTPLHKSSPPPSAFQFLFLHKPSIEVTKVTESQNSNYVHTTCHVCNPGTKLHHANVFSRSVFRSADSNLRLSVSRNVFKVKTHDGGGVEEKTNAKQRLLRLKMFSLVQIRLHASSSMCAFLCCLC